MNSTAYDTKPEGPVRTELDRPAVERALRFGSKLAVNAGCDPDDWRTVVWALFVEAARTERAIAKPGPTGFGTGYPDIWYTAAEIRGTENQWAADRIEYTPEIKPNASAAQMDRHATVTVWLRFMHGADKLRLLRIVWWRAHGRSVSWIAKQEGMSASQIRRIKNDQLDNIIDRLKAELKGFELFA